MSRLKGTLGYIWAILAFFIVAATFIGNNPFSRMLASATGVTVSAWYSGGEVAKTIDHGIYHTLLHRPVFDGLIGERKEGFVQIDWKSSDGLPPVIKERIDYNADGKEDFLVVLNTNTGVTTLTPYSPFVLSFERSYKLKDGWAVRIHLKRELKERR